MATLPNAKVAVRLALANYLRTNLAAAWPNLVVSENWPTPQAVFPPQAITVLAPSSGQVVRYHQPVIWSTVPLTTTTATVTYSYGVLEIPLQLDAWAQFESIRDDVAATLTPLINRNPEITLGTQGPLAELSIAPGLVIPIPSYYNVTAEYVFAPAPSPQESSDSSIAGEWRATWLGTATIYLMNQETVPLLTQFNLNIASLPDESDSATLATFSSKYAVNVALDSPVAYYPLNDASGIVALDYTGNNHPATFVAPSELTYGLGGLITGGDNAVGARGTQFANFVTPNLALAGSWSLEFWTRPTKSFTSFQVINSTISGFTFQAIVGPRGEVTLGPFTTSDLPAGTFTAQTTGYYVLTYDGATLSFYKNGSLLSAKAFSTTPFGSFTLVPPWNGALDEVAIYNAVLSPTRIAAHYTAGTT